MQSEMNAQVLSGAPVRTGVSGLDEILNGGLTPNRLYLLDGNPGAGKTTLALQFLKCGAALGERVLYLTLSETQAELTDTARAHGWSLEGIRIKEYIPTDGALERDAGLTMFHSAEVELGETLSRILADIEAERPQRIVIDSLSEVRLLSETPLRYRRQILALKRYFSERACTVLLLDDRSESDGDAHVQSITNGVISLEHTVTPYGCDQRRLRVRKMRGRVFQQGLHDYTIRTGGLVVFPRLARAEPGSTECGILSSGIPALDALLGGGPQAGTSTLFTGPAGCGKTTIAMQYVAAAAARGVKASVFLFDELASLMCDRLRAVGHDLGGLVEKGILCLRQLAPTELSPGEFAFQVRQQVESGVRIIVIDSLNGYLNAMPHDPFLAAQLHELLAYLGSRGVTTLMIVGQQGIVGSHMPTPVDASYLADSIVLFRFFELQGEVRKAISVTKKRGGSHENTIRELTIDAGGVRVGDPLSKFQGVLTGVPMLPDSTTLKMGLTSNT